MPLVASATSENRSEEPALLTEIRGTLALSCSPHVAAPGKLGIVDEVREILETSLRTRPEESFDPMESSKENAGVVEMPEEPSVENKTKFGKGATLSAVGGVGVVPCFTYAPDTCSMADLDITLGSPARPAPKV